jgi:adenylyl-sulfate kinase
VADVTLQLGKAIAFDLAADLAATGRFVVVDDYEIRGGGIVRAALPDRQAWARDKVLLRNWKWEPSFISADQRAERTGQSPLLLLLTGPVEGGAARKQLARELEARLFAQGRQVYFLGIGNVLYGVDADLERRREERAEHMRRLAEVAHLMLDAGTVLVVTAAELTREDLDVIGTGVAPERVRTAWLGGEVTTDVTVDVQLPGAGALEALDRVVAAGSTRPSLRASAPLLPCVLWFTGLSGAGKSTIADRVTDELRRRGHPVERLDGDTVRGMFPGTGFGREERNEHVRRIGFLASTLERHGVFVVASFISPYQESREFVRGLCRRFVEVFVDTPLEECERRDVKGLYARARRGEVPQFTGISDPYEPPVAPELTIDTTSLTPDGAAQQVFEYLWRHAGQ